MFKNLANKVVVDDFLSEDMTLEFQCSVSEKLGDACHARHQHQSELQHVEHTIEHH